MDSIDFLVDNEPRPGTPPSLVPIVNEVRLDKLVERFEDAQGFDDPAGGYGGLIRWDYEAGTAKEHYFTSGRVAVLGCECGESGCWPMLVTIETEANTVTWKGFRQPFRPQRDYTSFGPFTFDLVEYTSALDRAIGDGTSG